MLVNVKRILNIELNKVTKDMIGIQLQLCSRVSILLNAVGGDTLRYLQISRGKPLQMGYMFLSCNCVK